MQEFETGDVRANGLRFGYLEMGQGLLALCLHGFPDSAWTYRYLLPELAGAGYRAVAPFMRGYAPTEVPADRHYVHTSTMAADVVALHEALGGDGDAVLVAHDWGAIAAYGAAGSEPERWRRCVIINVPPFRIFGENAWRYDQIKRSFYFYFFQTQAAEGVVAANDFAFIDGLWADWSPGYDAAEDLARAKECLRDPANLQAALGYYWAQFDPRRAGTPGWNEEQEAAWGHPLPQPVLYLHGTQDGCHALDAEQANRALDRLGEGSESEMVEGVGHFMLVEKPEEINARILQFLGST